MQNFPGSDPPDFGSRPAGSEAPHRGTRDGGLDFRRRGISRGRVDNVSPVALGRIGQHRADGLTRQAWEILQNLTFAHAAGKAR